MERKNHHTIKKAFCLYLLVILICPGLSAQGKIDLELYDYWQYYSDVENSLYKHLSASAFQQLEMRRSEVEKLKTEEDWLNRQKLVSEKLAEIVNLPERTPLNASVQGVSKKDGYRIEKVLYESRPGYYVTGAIYIPNGLKEKAPAIFYACGHSRTGFRAETYQHIIINLVKKGFVVFTIDPMGQGERYEYWDQQKGESKYPIPDHEHSYAGAQCLIAGYSTGNNFIWDAIRGIDYMLTRKEIDPDRIGMTGRSGGGNITAYVGALDDRILATAPECYITSYEYLYKSIGPQCAEQNLYGFLGAGLDHADFLIARAPKPTLVVSTTRDFFSIQGTRASYQGAKKMYEVLGMDEELRMVEDDSIHKSTKKNREAMYAFFQRELDNPGDSSDVKVDIPDSKELKVTPTGQVVTSYPKSQSVFSMNLKILESHISGLDALRNNEEDHLKRVKSRVQELMKRSKPFGQPVFSGRYNQSELVIEKYLVPGSGDYMIPVVLLKPGNKGIEEVVLIADSQGKNHAVTKDSIVTTLLDAGNAVLLFDLPGIGSMGPGYLKGDSYISNTSYNQWFAANLTGQSIVGLRAGDIVRLIHFVTESIKESWRVSALAVGPLSGELLHAAIVEPVLKNIILVKPLLSYADIAATRFYKPKFIPFAAMGVIQNYDLPDLMAGLCPRDLLIINPQNADGSPAGRDKSLEMLWFSKDTYDKENPDAFNLRMGLGAMEVNKQIVTWLDEKSIQ